MWHEMGIQDVEREACRFPADEYMREHITAMNFYFLHYTGERQGRKKERLWKAMEAEADLIVMRLAQLGVEH